MTYEEALLYLKSRERFGIKFGLENVGRLAEVLGSPQRRYDSILIAGTNGKGSTAAMVESILRASGLRTGRYTSPHLRRVEERIAVGGAPISREELADSVTRVAGAAQTLWGGADSAPTFFEAITAAGLLAFAERKVEVAVLEVGMGGRFDATNIVPAAVAAVAPIGFDHERFLGGTLAEIAAEKAAIVKEGRPVVVGRQPEEALEVLRREAGLRQAKLIEALEGAVLEVLGAGDNGARRLRLSTPERDYGVLQLPLEGDHQLDNLVLAIRIAECFTELSPGDVARGIADTRWPGRLQRIPGAPPLLLDAAHNVMATDALARYLESHPHPNRILLFGVMKDKRVGEMLDRLLPLVSGLVATRPEMSRARGPEQLARWARNRGLPAEAHRSAASALARARELAGPEGEVLVAGSIFLLGEVLQVLDREPPFIAAVEPAASHRAVRTPG